MRFVQTVQNYTPNRFFVLEMKKRILLVDDEIDIIDPFSHFLTMAGFEVETAKNGKEAFEKVINAKNKDKTIDLILTDIQIPDMSGIELMKKLNGEKVITPFIVVSSYGDNINLLKSVELGCVDFIFKPVSPESLTKRINSYFDKQLMGNCE